MVLSGIAPTRVFKYFEDICNIPHGSGNTRKISDYCVEFALANDLWYRQDEYNNVIIKKSASKGYETHPSVIIQGHLDMVCEKLPDVDIDFETEPIKIKIENGYITADGTTLGGDDGIAVAMALAVLEDNSLQHPELYAVFTVDEETAMTGATYIDLSDVESKTLINIDSENEGVLTVSCAGGIRCLTKLQLNKIPNDKNAYKIALSGLTGGHSGVEIHKNRLNANVVISSILNFISEKAELHLVSIKGGNKDNAITRESESVIATDLDIITISELCDEFISTIDKTRDADFELTITAVNSDFAYDNSSTKSAISLLNEFPYGVVAMSKDIDGLVETSLNLGIVDVINDVLTIAHSVRSSKNNDKDMLVSKLEMTAKKHNAKFSVSGSYPAWEYNENSLLRDTMIRVYNKLYGRVPVIEAIHAGLECGLLGEKIKGLDAVSFGPDMECIHTPDEKLSISSVERTYDYLCEILKEL